MAVVISVVAKSNIKMILQVHQARHGIRRGTIHPDFSIMIERHKRKRGIHAGIHHLHLEPVHFCNGRPICHTRAAHGIHSNLQPGCSNLIHLHNMAQTFHVRHNIIHMMGGGCLESLFHGNPVDFLHPVCHDLIGSVLNPPGGNSIRRSGGRRVIFETAILRRVV